MIPPPKGRRMSAGLVFFNDGPSDSNGSVARVRASHARQVVGEKPDEEAIHRFCRIAEG
jgi:hypothetical protein